MTECSKLRFWQNMRYEESVRHRLGRVVGCGEDFGLLYDEQMIEY